MARPEVGQGRGGRRAFLREVAALMPALSFFQLPTCGGRSPGDRPEIGGRGARGEREIGARSGAARLDPAVLDLSEQRRGLLLVL